MKTFMEWITDQPIHSKPDCVTEMYTESQSDPKRKALLDFLSYFRLPT